MNRHERRKYAAIHGKPALSKLLLKDIPTIHVNRHYAANKGISEDSVMMFAGDDTAYAVRIVDGEGEIT